jgi:4-amino-4-deoxy-L-arabinose transferase-like glycosyltransferase
MVRLAALIVALLAVYLVGNDRVALWDRDEPRYAQTSRQMAASGDWIVPRLLDDVRTAKPIFIYWCQATAMRLFGDTVFAARLPSAIGMALTLALVGGGVYFVAGERRALWSVFILGTSGLSIAAAKMCITDAVLLLWVTLAHICLLAIYAGARHRGVAVLMWIAIGLAGLTKGPVVLGILLMTMVVLLIIDAAERPRLAAAREAVKWWKRTRPLMGLALLTIVCGPWLVMLHLREPTFLPQTIGHDVVTRVREPLEGHAGPPGYYLLTIWITYFPWSLLLPAAIVFAWRYRRLTVLRYALAAVVGPWLMFEAVQTKLPHYVLPTFPALAFLTAVMLRRAAQRPAKSMLLRWPFLVFAGVWAIIVMAAGSGLWIAVARFAHPPIGIAAAAMMSVLGLLYGPMVLHSFATKRPVRAGILLGCGMIGVAVIMYGLYFPHAPYLRLSPRLAAALPYQAAIERDELVMIDYSETSLAFYQGGQIRPREREFLEQTPPAQWPTWVVVTERVWSTLPAEDRAAYTIVKRVRGWNYADDGEVVDVLVVSKSGDFRQAN